MASKRKSLKGLLKGPSQVFHWDDFSGSMDEGSPSYKMPLNNFSYLSNVWTDERDGVIVKRQGFSTATDAKSSTTTENMFGFRKGDGTERLLRSYHTGTSTLIEELNVTGTAWAEIFYTGAAAVGTVATNNVWTETGSHVHAFDDWIKVGDNLATSAASTTFKPITSVTSTAITCSAGGLTDGASQTFTVRKDLGNLAFVEFISYKDHAWWASGTSNFLMAYDGVDIFENPNDWVSGAPARRSGDTDCPKGTVLAIWGERMWIGGLSGTNGLSLLRYAPISYERANNPDEIMWNTLNEEPVSINDGSIIRWLKNAHERLYIGKDNRTKGVWFLQGSNPDDWVLRGVDGSQGGRYGRIVQIIPSGPLEGSLFWLGDEDFFAFNPSMLKPKALGGSLLAETRKDISTSIWNPGSSNWPSDNAFSDGTDNNTTSTSGTTGTVTLVASTDVDTAFDGTKTSTSSTIISGSVIIDHDASNFYRDHQNTSNDGTMDDQTSSLSQTISTPSYRLLRPTIRVNLKKTGTPTGNVVADLYSVDQNQLPLTLLETSATTVTTAGIGTSYATADFTFTNTLSPNTLGAIVLRTSVATTSSNKIHWGFGGSDTGFEQRAEFKSSSWSKKTNHFDLRIFQYIDTGTRTYVSAEIDTSISTPTWGTLVATETLNGGTVTYSTRTKDSSGFNGQTYTEVANGEKITSNQNRWIQWRAVFTNLAAGDTPKVDDVTIQWAPSTATWTSKDNPAPDAGTSVNNWGAFTTVENKGGNGTIAWKIAFDDNADVGTGSGVARVLATIVPGQSIASLGTPPGILDKFMLLEATLSTTDLTTGLPVVNEASINWTEGEAPTTLPSSGVFDNRIYTFFTRKGENAPAITTPKPGFVYDRNGNWGTVTLTVNLATHRGGSGFTIYQNNLYLGSVSNNAVMFMERGDPVITDHGSILVSTIFSPVFDMGARNINKWFRKFVITGEAGGAGGQLQVDYAIDENIADVLYDSLDIDQDIAAGITLGGKGNVNNLPTAHTRIEYQKHINFDFGTFGKLIAFRVVQAGGSSMGFLSIAVHYDLMPDIDTDDTQSTTLLYDK